MTLNVRKADEIWGAAYKGVPARKNLHRFFFGGFSEAEKQRMHFPERRFHTIEDPVMTPDIMSYFFKQCTDGLCGLSDKQIKMLGNIYREPAYQSVWPKASGDDWQNRRAHQRLDVACTGLLRGQRPESIKLRVLDASRKGLRIRADRPIDDASISRLSIAVGNQISVALNARTRWQKGRVYGLEVVNAGAAWQRFIDYLEERRNIKTASRRFRVKRSQPVEAIE